jgi:diguanylate cyclase (GGDEF)-like protein
MSANSKHHHIKTIRLKAFDPNPDENAQNDKIAYLTVIRGGHSDFGRTCQIHDEVFLGRDPECQLNLTDPRISWRHAKVSKQEDGFWLEDCKSTNGTRLKDHSLEEAVELHNGIKIFLGATVIRFGLADEMELGFWQEVAQLVGTDPLTGLESKQCFDDALDQALAAALDSASSLTVLMMDMDHIKTINDTHGHLFGAYCIRTAGKIIGQTLSATGRACRFGGDEFIAFIPGANQDEGIQQAEQIRKSIEAAQMEKEGIHLKPTISIGIAVFPRAGQEVLDLIAQADQALYRAKAKGKNAVSI